MGLTCCLGKCNIGRVAKKEGKEKDMYEIKGKDKQEEEARLIQRRMKEGKN